MGLLSSHAAVCYISLCIDMTISKQTLSAILRTCQKIHTTLQLSRFCVAAIHLCVLQTAVASLQSADCDTEWLIGINVVTGGVLCRKRIIRIYGSLAVDIVWVHKNVNQYVSVP